MVPLGFGLLGGASRDGLFDLPIQAGEPVLYLSKRTKDVILVQPLQFWVQWRLESRS